MADPYLIEARDMSQKLYERSSTIKTYNDYYENNPPMPWLSSRASKNYSELLRESRTNWAGLVIDVVNDRLMVEGFRSGDEDLDDRLWNELWQPNNLDMYSTMMSLDALIFGVSYSLSWPDDSLPGGVSVTGESPMEMIHEFESGSRKKVIKALKSWYDEQAEVWRGLLFLEEGVFRLFAKGNGGTDGGGMPPQSWELVNDGEPNPIPNPSADGTVPVVPFLNRPRLSGLGMSEIGDALTILDRINTLNAQMLLVGELAAFRIRWATGLEIPVDAETGNPVEPFNVAMDKLWVSEDPDTKFGQFEATSLSGYMEAIDQAVQQMASMTRTPPFLLMGKLTNLSAEALKATESGLVAKVQNRMRVYGEAWEDTMRVALGMQPGSPDLGELDRIETVWRDPENVSEAQRVDALLKMSTLGVPNEVLWEKWGATPQEVTAWKEMQMNQVFEDILRGAAAGAQVPAVDPNAAPPTQGPQGPENPGQALSMPRTPQ